MNIAWLIYSREHNAWWRQGEAGYTESLRVAGRYSLADANRIVGQANIAAPTDRPEEFMMLAPESVTSIADEFKTISEQVGLIKEKLNVLRER